MSTEKKDVFRPTDDEARRLAKTLLRTARSGSLAVLDAKSGAPLISRTGVSTDIDGTPVILISRLAAHTAALLADERCSLMVGEPGKGDPLAHPRLSIETRATELALESEDDKRVRGRYLRHQPKAALYAGLGDFRFFALKPVAASLNGGFGKAYLMTDADILSGPVDGLADAEEGTVRHMNEDHADAVDLYAGFYAGAPAGNWKLLGLDGEGMDIGNGDDVRRVFFPRVLKEAGEVRAMLVEMAQAARKGAVA